MIQPIAKLLIIARRKAARVDRQQRVNACEHPSVTASANATPASPSGGGAQSPSEASSRSDRARKDHRFATQGTTESVEREEAGVQLYRDLMEMVKDKSIALEEYAQRLVAAEVVHIREMELMLMKSAPE